MNRIRLRAVMLPGQKAVRMRVLTPKTRRCKKMEKISMTPTYLLSLE